MLTTDEADDAKLRYDEFVDSEFPKHREKFTTFDKSTDVVDLFFGEFLHKNEKRIGFRKVCGIIFVLSHGQSTVERGFSASKQLLRTCKKNTQYFSESYITTSTQIRLKPKSIIFRVIFSKTINWKTVCT